MVPGTEQQHRFSQEPQNKDFSLSPTPPQFVPRCLSFMRALASFLWRLCPFLSPHSSCSHKSQPPTESLDKAATDSWRMLCFGLRPPSSLSPTEPSFISQVCQPLPCTDPVTEPLSPQALGHGTAPLALMSTWALCSAAYHIPFLL